MSTELGINFIGRVNGIWVDGRKASPEEVRKLELIFPEVEKQFKAALRSSVGWNQRVGANHELAMAVGYRSDFAGLLERLRGHCVFEEYTPGEWLMDAMRDACKADYYYRFEKEW